MVEKDFFVGIYEPRDVRRNVLESSKEIVNSLQSHDALKTIRRKKLAHYREMRQIMKELDFLVAKLENGLPKPHLRKTHGSSKNKFSDSSVKKLDKQLKDIEKEISG